MLTSSGLSEKKGTRSASLAAHSVACGSVGATPYPNLDEHRPGTTYPNLQQANQESRNYEGNTVNHNDRDYGDDIEPVAIGGMAPWTLWLIIGCLVLALCLCVGLCCVKSKLGVDDKKKVPPTETERKPPPGEPDSSEEEEQPSDSEDSEEVKVKFQPAPYEPPPSYEDALIDDKIRAMVVKTDPANQPHVVGIKKIKSAIEKILQAKLKPEIFTGLLSPQGSTSGILLFGPSGCGKTTIASWISHMEGFTFLEVKPELLISNISGQTEKNIARLFEFAEENEPSILFIDEVDRVALERKPTDSTAVTAMKAAFLTQMDGFEKNKGVIVLGTTNVPWNLDKSMLTRFGYQFYIPVPDAEGRREMFQSIKLKYPEFNDIEDDFLKRVASPLAWDGFTYKDINAIARTAANFSLDELMNSLTTNKKVNTPTSWHQLTKEMLKERRPMTNADINSAKNRHQKSTTFKDLNSFFHWNKDYGYKLG